MLYYVAQWLMPYHSALNVFTYHTVRAGGAALTGFVISLLIGPAVIRWLRALKIGQYIREDHVADLHALHKSKAGTPTMGGVLIILSTVLSLLLWGRFENRLLVASVAVLCLLGGVGFMDDYLKIRRKHNLGLTARAKSLGQLLVGLGLGVYLVYAPITVSATYLSDRDVIDWKGFVDALKQLGESETPTAGRVFWELLDADLRERLTRHEWEAIGSPRMRAELRDSLNATLRTADLSAQAPIQALELSDEGAYLLRQEAARLGERDLARLNRLLLEAAFPGFLSESLPGLHTRVEIPGLRWALIPMGGFYALFVLIIVYSSSNAVNLTDGLDGLAIGASIMSLLAYTAISYVVSRADWSQYLFLIHVPEASELTVFGAAMLGTGLGFLWFNSHPAEVFMGDTGALALGGAIGAMAVLTKQELLLVVVGGLFVMEAASVIIQVASFRLRGKRVFKMAPLHHHFELLGWSETKVTIRFWIIALLFALMSLGALKLR